jgi:hypothetical protein
MNDYKSNVVDSFLDCIYGKVEEQPIEEKYVKGDVENAHKYDHNIIIETGEVNFFKTMDIVLQVVGMLEVIITEVPVGELHYYDDWPKSNFAGQGIFATVQFNVKP